MVPGGGMKRIDELLLSVTRTLGLGMGLRRQKVLDRWEEAAGPGLSGLSSPDGFEGDVLRVAARHPAAVMELRIHRSEILRRLNEMAGETVFSEMRILAPGRRRG